MSFIKVIGMGTVANPPRPWTSEAGKSKVELRVLAANLHHTVVGWEGVGDGIAEGDTVLFEGRLSYRSYDKDGTKVWVTEIVANEITKIGVDDAAVAPVAGTAADSDLGF